MIEWTLAEQFIDSLEDSGRWREVGITHWHLLREEDVIRLPDGRLNMRRFDTNCIRYEVAETTNISRDPYEVMKWLYQEMVISLLNSSNSCKYIPQHGWHTQEDLHFRIGVSWEFLTKQLPPRNFVPSGRGTEIRHNWSLDVHAYPHTVAMCSLHEPAS